MSSHLDIFPRVLGWINLLLNENVRKESEIKKWQNHSITSKENKLEKFAFRNDLKCSLALSG